MDPRFHQFLNGSQLMNQSLVTEISSRRIANGSRFESTYTQRDPKLGVPQLFPVPNGDVHGSSLYVIDDDSGFSDAVLRYIDHILMDEDIDEKSGMLGEWSDLRAKEMSFYELLGQKYPDNPNDFPSVNTAYSTTSSSDCSGYLSDMIEPSLYNTSRADSYSSHVSCSTFVRKLYTNSSNSSSNIADGLSPVSPLQIWDRSGENQSMWNFEKGVEEATNFRPCKSNMFVNVNPPRESVLMKVERKGEVERDSCVKKNHHVAERDLNDERSNKLPAISKE